MPPQGKAYFVDWVFSPKAQIHVASHIGWFTDFVRVNVPITCVENSMRAFAIGTVEIPVETDKGLQIFTLHNVFYVPGFPCNVFAYDALDILDFGYEINSAPTFKRHDRANYIYLEKLWLRPGRNGYIILDNTGNGSFSTVRIAGTRQSPSARLRENSSWVDFHIKAAVFDGNPEFLTPRNEEIDQIISVCSHILPERVAIVKSQYNMKSISNILDQGGNALEFGNLPN